MTTSLTGVVHRRSRVEGSSAATALFAASSPSTNTTTPCVPTLGSIAGVPRGPSALTTVHNTRPVTGSRPTTRALPVATASPGTMATEESLASPGSSLFQTFFSGGCAAPGASPACWGPPWREDQLCVDSARPGDPNAPTIARTAATAPMRDTHLGVQGRSGRGSRGVVRTSKPAHSRSGGPREGRGAPGGSSRPRSRAREATWDRRRSSRPAPRSEGAE